MPPIAHFFLGYALALLFILVLFFGLRKYIYLIWIFLISLLGGLCACIPDLEAFLHIQFHNQPWTNLFFLHQFLDREMFVTDLWFSVEMFVWFVSINFYFLVFIVDPVKSIKKIMRKEKLSDEFRYID